MRTTHARRLRELPRPGQGGAIPGAGGGRIRVPRQDEGEIGVINFLCDTWNANPHYTVCLNYVNALFLLIILE